MSSPSELLGTPNSLYLHKAAFYDYFGPPDCYQPSDIPNIDEYNRDEDYTNAFLYMTRRLHALIPEVFLASLDDVRVQRMSLGRDRFHLFLDNGVVAAESYWSARVCERLSQLVGETQTLSTPGGPLSFNAYQVCDQDSQVDEPCVLLSHMWMNN